MTASCMYNVYSFFLCVQPVFCLKPSIINPYVKKQSGVSVLIYKQLAMTF